MGYRFCRKIARGVAPRQRRRARRDQDLERGTADDSLRCSPKPQNPVRGGMFIEIPGRLRMSENVRVAHFYKHATLTGFWILMLFSAATGLWRKLLSRTAVRHHCISRLHPDRASPQGRD